MSGVTIETCPHCQGPIIIEAINCGIFRHGIYRANGQQIPPHTPKVKCEQLIQQNLIWGCGKPFRYDGKTISKCDYI